MENIQRQDDGPPDRVSYFGGAGGGGSRGPSLVTERAIFAEWYVLTRAERRQAEFPATEKAFCKKYLVSNGTLWRWKHDPEFEREVSQRRASSVRSQIGKALPKITRALIKEAESGDVPAIKEAYVVAGVHQDAAVEIGVGVGVGVSVESAVLSAGESWEPPEWAKRERRNGGS